MSQAPGELRTADDAWAEALDDLERRVADAEQQLRRIAPAEEPTPWTPPQLDGPLPAALVGRARDLLERQRDVIARTPVAAAELRRHQGVVNRISQATARSSRPVYIDTSA